MNIKNKQEGPQGFHYHKAILHFEELISNINLLKNIKYGCPWQKQQTHETLIPYLIEESDEFINSIKNNDHENMREELGDLLLQIMLHTEITKEKHLFSIAEVIEDLNKKIKLRHPYIFKKKENVSIEEAQRIWKNLKSKNKSNQKNKHNFSKINLLFMKSFQETEIINYELEKRGFEWDSNKEILNKICEEIEELKAAIRNNDQENIEEEFGDTLFTLISLSTFLKIDSNKALERANQKFKQRFSMVEKILNDRMHQNNLGFKELWNLAKEKLNKTNNT